MTSFQELCQWDEQKLDDAVCMIEARWATAAAERKAYKRRCYELELEESDDTVSFYGELVHSLWCEAKTYKDALEHVRGMDELADTNRLAASVRGQQV